MSMLCKCPQVCIMSEFINVTDHANVKLLLEPEESLDFFPECDNTVYVKQHKEIWKRIRGMHPVTGSK